MRLSRSSGSSPILKFWLASFNIKNEQINFTHVEDFEKLQWKYAFSIWADALLNIFCSSLQNSIHSIR